MKTTNISIFIITIKGEAWVNNVRILGWAKVPNGIIISIRDFLFTEQLDKELLDNNPRILEGESKENLVVPVTTTTTSTTTTTEFVPPVGWVLKEKCSVMDAGGLFKNIVVCEDVWVDPNADEFDSDLASRQKEVRKTEETEEKLEEQVRFFFQFSAIETGCFNLDDNRSWWYTIFVINFNYHYTVLYKTSG